MIDLTSVPAGNRTCAVPVIRGIMLATKGILSIIAELIAENHKVVIAVKNIVSALGFVSKIMPSESFESKPAFWIFFMSDGPNLKLFEFSNKCNMIGIRTSSLN